MVSFHFQFSSESQSCLQLSLRWSARRLSLRDDHEGHFKEDCTILFHKLRHSQDIFCLFIFTYLWRTLRRVARFFFVKDQSDFYHKV